MPLLKKKSKKNRVAESDLSAPVRRFLSQQGCARVIRELQFFDRSIDVYGVSWGDDTKTIAVELKLTKWQKALQQAALYQLCSDYAYVALPKKLAATLASTSTDFSAAGIGILAVDTSSRDVEIVLPAMRSASSNQHYIGTYKEILSRR